MARQMGERGYPLWHHHRQFGKKKFESGKNRGVRVRRGWLPGPPAWGPWVPVPEGILQAACQRRQPDLKEQVGAAAAPTHRLLLGRASADDPLDPRFDRSRQEALA